MHRLTAPSRTGQGPRAPVRSLGWRQALALALLLMGSPVARAADTWTGADIGVVPQPGSHGEEHAAGTVTVTGSGLDISGSTQRHHFAYRAEAGDFTLIARLRSLSGGVAGLMVRKGLATLDPNGFIGLDSGGGVHWQNVGLTTENLRFAVSGTRPVWLKLTRTGTRVDGHWSTDGIVWVQHQGTGGLPTTAAFNAQLPEPISIGFAVCPLSPTGTATAVFESITVDSRNTIVPPVLGTIPDQTVDEDGVISGLVLPITDADTPLPALTITASSDNPHLIWANDLVLGGTATTRTLTMRPDRDRHGTARITVRVSDIRGIATTSFALTVRPVNDPPRAIGTVITSEQDQPVDHLLRGEDVDGDALTFALTASPDHGELSGTPPRLQYVPDPGFTGDDRVLFTATDGRVVSAPATIVFRVAAKSAPPAGPVEVHESGPPCGPGIGLTAIALLLVQGWLRQRCLRGGRGC